MAEYQPALVSIGMMVRNESEYIGKALESLCAQTYPHIRIFISDNASDDGTSEVCERFAQQYPHIVYDRLEQNIGALENFKRVVERASGEYFMLASGHDCWSENFVEACVEELVSDPESVVSFGTNAWIDSDGAVTPVRTGWIDTRELDPVARFFVVLWGNMHPIYGVIRTPAMKQVYDAAEGPGADLVQLEKLAMMGYFAHARSATFYRRAVRQREDFKKRINRYKADAKILSMPLDRVFPLLRLPFRLLAVVWGSEEHWGMKTAMSLSVIPLFFVRYLIGRKTIR